MTTLEKEISQSKFRNVQHKAGVNLIYTYNWLIRQMKSSFDDVDLTPQQYNVLRILRGQMEKKSNMSTIRDRMLDKSADLTRIVDRLVIKGLVARTKNSFDKRAMDIGITDAGLKLLTDLDYIDSSFDNIMAGLDEDELSLLNNLLDKMRNNAG